MADETNNTMGADFAAHILKIEPAEFNRLARTRRFQTIKGRFPLVATVHGFIEYLHDRYRRTGRTATDAARAIDVGQRRFFELLDTNVIERKTKEQGYDLDAVTLQYIRHLRKSAAGRIEGDDASLGVERARLARAQTTAITLKNDIAVGRYVAIEDIISQIEEIFTIIRQRLLVIPGKLAYSLLNQDDRDVIHRTLEDEITEALNELSNPDRIAERASQIEGGPVPGDAPVARAAKAKSH